SLGDLLYFLTGAEVHLAIVAQAGERRCKRARAQDLAPQLGDLRVDAGDLLEADAVQLPRLEPGGRVRVCQRRVAIEPAQEVAQASVRLVPRAGESLFGQE